jgi:hypothetical protein
VKLHTSLDYMGVAFALKKAKDDGHVTDDVCFQGGLKPSGSRTHPRAFEVQLGTDDKTSLPGGYTDQRGNRMNVRRYKNSGSCGAGSVYAATWDEWGWFMANVFATDPQAVFGSVTGREHSYRGEADFHAQTGGKFNSATRDAFGAIVEDMRRVQRNLEEDRKEACE